MTCEIRVSVKNDTVSSDYSFFSIENSSLDQAGAMVAILARKALEGKIGKATDRLGRSFKSNDRYDIFENVIDWFETKCSRQFLSGDLESADYYYHIELSNDRDSKLQVEIGYSRFDGPVSYVSVSDFIKNVNTSRKLYNQCMIPFLVRGRHIREDSYKLLRKVRKARI